MKETDPGNGLTGTEKAAILLIALGAKSASNVLKHLSQEEMLTLCSHVAKTKDINQDRRRQVIEEFTGSPPTAGMMGGLEYAQELLEETLGGVKAKKALTEIVTRPGTRPFDWLLRISTSIVATCLQHERPQVVALILAHLDADYAADVLSQLSNNTRGDVAYRLTTMRPVAPDVVRGLDAQLAERLSQQSQGEFKAVGGVQSLVTILNNADRPTESMILQYLQQVEPDTAESVREMMFVFEDILKLDDQTLRTIIRELQQDDMRLSLKGSTDTIKDAFFRNMSERAAEALKEDIEMTGPVRVRDVQAAQRRVVAVIRRLEEAGEISIRPDGDEVIN